MAGSWNEVNKYPCFEQDITRHNDSAMTAKRNVDMNFAFNMYCYFIPYLEIASPFFLVITLRVIVISKQDLSELKQSGSFTEIASCLEMTTIVQVKPKLNFLQHQHPIITICRFSGRIKLLNTLIFKFANCSNFSRSRVEP